MDGATGKLFGDGSNILYVNGKYRGEDEIGKLMHDFGCSEADDMVFPLMAEQTRYLKENPKGVAQMCKMMEDMREESEARGIEKGLEQGKLEMLAGLVRDKILTIDQAASRRSLTVDDFKKQCVKYNLTL